jgi:DNA anti-recombination protein RmuC
MDTDLLGRLGQAALECRSLIRQAHEAQQDLKQSLRELQAAHEQVRAHTKQAMAISAEQIAEQLSALIGRAADDIQQVCTEVVGQRMTEVSDHIEEELIKLRTKLTGRLDLRLERVGDQVVLSTLLDAEP